jgi:hypothetical protein
MRGARTRDARRLENAYRFSIPMPDGQTLATTTRPKDANEMNSRPERDDGPRYEGRDRPGQGTMSDRAQPGGNKSIRLSHDPRVDVLKDAFSGAMEAGGVEGKIGALAVEKAAKALGLDLEEIVSSHRQEIHHRRLEESRRYEPATGVLPSGRTTSANPYGSTRRRSQHVAMPAAKPRFFAKKRRKPAWK